MSTDLWQGALIDGAIWHGRSGDVSRQFSYRATYAALPLGPFERGELPLQPDRAGLWSIRLRDHGWRDSRPLAAFIRDRLAPAGLEACEVTLVTMPCSTGYGFNPVSFWLARDAQGLRAVLAEVCNTFGESHAYLVRHVDGGVIAPTDRIEGQKLFHVSPFLPRQGRYVFRFDAGPGRFGAWVDWIAPDGATMLGTSLTGRARVLDRQSLRHAMLRRPLQAQLVTGLIHWQAARLYLRGLRYIRKPPQLEVTSSEATTLTRGSDV
ncbi:DUF1365 domain-containing protein [Paracoccus litorisediminis]|jgi:DUF1365 family protein|uniref:DUF1365 family protein n=1 Tax=Paracoccus litorisediminis TaxID=2006130 RepID=A0A844HYP8_9RHOB|nr:DUF1365 domain-containing protein [Paracoccus litorisediminis]MTH62562.1 DUF1365 family protein [Paracoccus litorisediminis]